MQQRLEETCNYSVQAAWGVLAQRMLCSDVTNRRLRAIMVVLARGMDVCAAPVVAVLADSDGNSPTGYESSVALFKHVTAAVRHILHAVDKAVGAAGGIMRDLQKDCSNLGASVLALHEFFGIFLTPGPPALLPNTVLMHLAYCLHTVSRLGFVLRACAKDADLWQHLDSDALVDKLAVPVSEPFSGGAAHRGVYSRPRRGITANPSPWSADGALPARQAERQAHRNGSGPAAGRQFQPDFSMLAQETATDGPDGAAAGVVSSPSASSAGGVAASAHATRDHADSLPPRQSSFAEHSQSEEGTSGSEDDDDADNGLSVPTSYEMSWAQGSPVAMAAHANDKLLRAMSADLSQLRKLLRQLQASDVSVMVLGDTVRQLTRIINALLCFKRTDDQEDMLQLLAGISMLGREHQRLQLLVRDLPVATPSLSPQDPSVLAALTCCRLAMELTAKAKPIMQRQRGEAVASRFWAAEDDDADEVIVAQDRPPHSHTSRNVPSNPFAMPNLRGGSPGQAAQPVSSPLATGNGAAGAGTSTGTSGGAGVGASGSAVADGTCGSTAAVPSTLDLGLGGSEVIYLDVAGEAGATPKQVAAATLPSLVQRATDSRRLDPVLSATLMLCYPGFTDSATLLELLLLRYQAHAAKTEPDAISVRAHVLNFLRQWVMFNGDDFANDRLRSRLEQFLRSLKGTRDELQGRRVLEVAHAWATADPIAALEALQGLQQATEYAVPAKLLPSMPAGADVDLQTWPRDEVARQVTLWFWRAFVGVRPRDLMQKAMHLPSPSWDLLRRRHEQLQNWAVDLILDAPSLDARCKAVTFIVKLCRGLLAENNFDGAQSLRLVFGELLGVGVGGAKERDPCKAMDKGMGRKEGKTRTEME